MKKITFESIIRMTDSYKVTHWRQLPKGTEHIFSFFESRGGRYDNVVFFGLQYFLKRYFEGQVVTEEDIEYAKEYFALHFGDPTLFNEEGWRYILKEHGGHLPVEIYAVPEGTSIPTSNVLMTVVNTDKKVPWLTNYLETILSQIWYPSTVATQSREMKKTILSYLDETGDPNSIDFKLHDFGYRGSTSVESAGIGAAEHHVNFKGTDTLRGIDVAREYYGEKMAGRSIPAAEHCTITSWGRENEASAYRNMLLQFPKGLVAVVSDSYDIYNACENIWGGELREEVMKRDGTLIIRPDSGNPPEVVVKVLNILGSKFGYSYVKGYKVLDPHVRIIQGDGIDHGMIKEILEAVKREGWSTDNLAKGSGGGLLQKVDRDTQKFAFKCSAACIDGLWHDVMKDPVTDPGKRSKAGRLKLIKESGSYRTVREEDSDLPNELVPVFRNGKILKEYSFDEIRKRAQIQ